ncbi:MAG: hypothetical protein JO164_09250 [Candidatus Eremiobacteraeota bacterium]|nr:hypothetical protein [Candidatus Eremiobacteraeota bacterium]
MSFAALLARLRASSPRMRLFGALAFVVLVGVAAIGFAASRDTRVTLFATSLRPDQLGEVEQRLAAWNVPYAASADNVRVDRGARGGLLLRLALAGVPHAHLAGTDEALAHVGALTPQAVLEAQTRDALAADLALGLRGLDGVADARVVIAPSSAGVFADDETRDASASVRVTLVPGAHLSARTVAGIKAFVAGGVAGLAAERVAVLDDRGLILDADVNDGNDVQTALQSALDAAFGAGATIVRVHREPLGEARDVRDVRRAALGGSVARSSSDERYASNAKKYSKTSATEDHGSETHEEHRTTGADATARLTVAVFVDSGRSLDLAKIRALAAAVAGVRPDRGDVISVEAVPFSDGTHATRGTHVPGWLLAFASILPQLITAAGLVLVVAIGIKPLTSLAVRIAESNAARTTARASAGVAPNRVYAALTAEPPHIAAAIIAGLPTTTAAAVLELYAPDERTAIVRRLPRANTALVPNPEDLVDAR